MSVEPRAAPTMPDTCFPVMGCVAHVAVEGDPKLLEDARVRIEDLDRRWSRFRPDSELSRLNASRVPVVVAPDTFELLTTALHAHRVTAGRFDPTVLPALVAAGYDRDFTAVLRRRTRRAHAVAVPGPSGVHLDRRTHSVRLKPGVTLDVGGIAKGHAAELVARELVAAGAVAAMVNLGGDLAVAGEPPPAGWPVRIADPRDAARTLLTIAVRSGAVATSSAVRRAWGTGRRRAHHVIDPALGRPADVALLAVTAIASHGWRAEALATAALLAGPARLEGLLVSRGGSGVVVDARGGVRVIGPVEVVA